MIFAAITGAAAFVLSAVVGLAFLRPSRNTSNTLRVIGAILLTASLLSALWCLIALLRVDVVVR
jgi:protein-S-isoprenylcysteine O-methyltransferase Ste14